MKIKMQLLSDVIFGSGVSVPGGEDISVLCDKDGFPYYKGSTFKGVFREELERYLQWTEEKEIKEKMSKPIISFKDNQFKLWKSAKCFADSVQLARTNVSKAIKDGTKARGFYVFYKNKNDRINNNPITKDKFYYKILKILDKEDVETIEKDFYVII